MTTPRASVLHVAQVSGVSDFDGFEKPYTRAFLAELDLSAETPDAESCLAPGAARHLVACVVGPVRL